MAGKDVIMLNKKELKRLHIVKKVFEGVIKQVEAGEILGLSERQIRRLVKEVRKGGSIILERWCRWTARITTGWREEVPNLY